MRREEGRRAHIVLAELQENVCALLILKEFIKSHDIRVPQIAVNANFSLKLLGNDQTREGRAIPFVWLMASLACLWKQLSKHIVIYWGEMFLRSIGQSHPGRIAIRGVEGRQRFESYLAKKFSFDKFILLNNFPFRIFDMLFNNFILMMVLVLLLNNIGGNIQHCGLNHFPISDHSRHWGIGVDIRRGGREMGGDGLREKRADRKCDQPLFFNDNLRTNGQEYTDPTVERYVVCVVGAWGCCVVHELKYN